MSPKIPSPPDASHSARLELLSAEAQENQAHALSCSTIPEELIGDEHPYGVSLMDCILRQANRTFHKGLIFDMTASIDMHCGDHVTSLCGMSVEG